MKSLEFYHDFISGVISGTANNEHDNSLHRALCNVFESFQSIIEHKDDANRARRLMASLSYFDDEIEKAGAYPPNNDMRSSNISEDFAKYIDKQSMKHTFMESKGLNLTKLGQHISSTSLTKVEYVAHRGLLNEAVRCFTKQFMSELVRSPDAKSLSASSSLSREQKLEKIQKMAINSLTSQIEANADPAGPNSDIR